MLFGNLHFDITYTLHAYFFPQICFILQLTTYIYKIKHLITNY